MMAFIGTSVLIVIILALAIPLLALATPIVIVWLIIRGIHRSSRPRGMSEPEETRIIQEIHRGLAGMEERIANLETIILEKEREKGATERPWNS